MLLNLYRQQCLFKFWPSAKDVEIACRKPVAAKSRSLDIGPAQGDIDMDSDDEFWKEAILLTV